MLTDKQKHQIRLMVSSNPTVENMERVALLSDNEVLAELDVFISDKLTKINEEETMLTNDIAFLTDKLANLQEVKSILS